MPNDPYLEASLNCSENNKNHVDGCLQKILLVSILANGFIYRNNIRGTFFRAIGASGQRFGRCVTHPRAGSAPGVEMMIMMISILVRVLRGHVTADDSFIDLGIIAALRHNMFPKYITCSPAFYVAS